MKTMDDYKVFLAAVRKETGIEALLIVPSANDSTQLEVVCSDGFGKYLKQ